MGHIAVFGNGSSLSSEDAAGGTGLRKRVKTALNVKSITYSRVCVDGGGYVAFVLLSRSCKGDIGVGGVVWDAGIGSNVSGVSDAP
jgi:hypothetical protein